MNSKPTRDERGRHRPATVTQQSLGESRLGLVAQLSLTVREALFAGAFPVYSYLYTLRPFRRLTRRRRTSTSLSAPFAVKNSACGRSKATGARLFHAGRSLSARRCSKATFAFPWNNSGAAPQDPDGCSEFERMLPARSGASPECSGSLARAQIHG